MEDYLHNPQMKHLARTIDAILSGDTANEQDWNLWKTLIEQTSKCILKNMF